jgi:hypothetical protein
MDLVKRRESIHRTRYKKRFNDENMELKHLAIIHKIPYCFLAKHQENLERFILRVYDLREGKVINDKDVIRANLYYQQFFNSKDI